MPSFVAQSAVQVEGKVIVPCTSSLRSALVARGEVDRSLSERSSSSVVGAESTGVGVVSWIGASVLGGVGSTGVSGVS